LCTGCACQLIIKENDDDDDDDLSQYSATSKTTINASNAEIPRLVGRLGPGARLVGRIAGSGVWAQ